MTVTLDLPEPPSANRLWRVGVGRVFRNPQYVRWRRDAGWELAAQRPGRLPHGEQISVTIRVGKSRKDADNLNKALLDLLQAHGVIRNDRDVGKITIERDDTIKTGRVLVEARTIKKKVAVA